jgi:ATP-dependent Clp protease ATP-binding subunit ClpC
MFERYTEAARRTLFFARYEASVLGGSTIEAEHLLLGLIRDGKGAVSEAFVVAGLTYSDARDDIEAQLGLRQPIPTSVGIPFSDAMQRILRHTMEQADALNHREIGREHLLLGILTDGSSFAARMLNTHGITAESFHGRLIEASGDIAHRDRPEVSAESSGPPSAIASLEQIRMLVDELARDDAIARTLIDQIHLRLEALRRRIGGM